MRQNVWIAAGLIIGLAVTGCSSGKYKKQLAERDERIETLQDDVVRLEGELDDEKKEAAALNSQLEKALADYKSQEQVMIQQKDAKSIVTVSEAVLFPSGNESMVESGKVVIDKIAEVAAGYPDRTILIEGHTDNVPIGAALKDKYYSNWELSSARACSVLRYLYWQHKMDPERLSAVGYGEHRPIADNDTPEGRAKNRRVVIVIGPKE